MPRWQSAFSALTAAAMLLVALAGPIRAEGEQPYGVSEFAVRWAPEAQDYPVVGGSWVVWRDSAGEVRRIQGRNLASGQDFMFTTSNDYGEFDLDGDLVVTSENALGQKGIFGYRLNSGFSRIVIAPLEGDSGFFRQSPRVSGHTVVWAQGTQPISSMDIYAYDLDSGRTTPVCTDPALQQWPVVSGQTVVWADRRNATGSSLFVQDLYGYDLAAGREFRITRQPEVIGMPAIAGNTVVWCAQHDRAYRLLAYDISSGQETVLASFGYAIASMDVDADGDLVVWSMPALPPYGDSDIYGYDLAQKQQFIICRAIGNQLTPRIAGHTVVWMDMRHQGIGKYDNNTDIYGATLTPGAAAVPGITGAPEAIDAKIEIVYPHGGAPVTAADRANVGTYLFLPGTLQPGPCQWHPQVLLWKAVNNGTARIVARATQRAYTPFWEHNDIDVSEARDPRSRIFFFVTVEGTPTRSNIWAHAADARTYFPRQDVPSGVAAMRSEVEAKIEIVYPHGGALVSQASLANISANLFVPGTLQSVPPEQDSTVHLWRSLNNGVAEEVAVGVKRLAMQNGLTYPVWDFNNVDVSAARDPMNKLYFTLSVDGAFTFTNVWAHGADARTYFPQQDTLARGCATE